METIRGTATNVHQHAKIEGSHDNLSTSYIVTMTLDGHPVNLSCASPAVIGNGDVVFVAGARRGRVFKALAYRNETNGATGGESRLRYSLLTTAFSGAWVMFVPDMVAENQYGVLITTGIAIATFAIVAFIWYVTIRSYRAHAAVN